MGDFEADSRKRTWWYGALWLSPPLLFALVVFVSQLLHVFDGVPFVGQELTGEQAAFLLGAMLVPVVAGCSCHMMWNRARARLSRNWQSVDGHVELSRIYEYQDWLLPWRRVCRLKVIYRYSVNAHEYVGDRVQFGFQLTSPELGETFAGRFPVGAEVPVHYDPGAPGDAVLDCSDNMASFQSWAVIAYFLSIYAVLVGMIAIANAIK